MVNPTTSSPWRVVVTRRVPTKAMDMLRDANLDLDIWDSDNPMPHEALVEKVSSGCDALYCVLTDKIGKDVLDAAGERLKMISTMSVGYNHIDYPECKKRGIPVSHTPNVLTETTADTAVALVLAACRRFKEATASVIEGTWGTWTPMGMCGQDVHDATVGIIGMGRIGSAVARRLHAFNCNIIYWGIERVPQLEEKLDAKFVEIDYLLKEADIVIPLCPLNKETYHMFDMSKFKAMKKSAVFVNPARGELVNQDDLLAALQQGEIFSAGLDVTTPEPLPKDHPLVKTPNCFILPHIGSASMGTRTAMAVLASENLVAAYKGKPLPTPVREF
ncbi:Glyoxylate reductase/hydroxypyruvate reductase [Gracilariopsis chorda]|uniref:Glyoxylate reductase/hydroxypyruvate reductase n=1 Tax=Gracilariopsis chorda TaxID=448386 RepID=A0A2V3IPY2_9FLOR|nr:Glyoxylate reductase/hydroxypyruvate reductase [Gracilariopsis chorda]|eukprot:PXF44119.1 Glyoxylate reductase/hydroxypyruvate reductase [Gracilariopsis chorda]